MNTWYVACYDHYRHHWRSSQPLNTYVLKIHNRFKFYLSQKCTLLIYTAVHLCISTIMLYDLIPISCWHHEIKLLDHTNSKIQAIFAAWSRSQSSPGTERRNMATVVKTKETTLNRVITKTAKVLLAVNQCSVTKRCFTDLFFFVIW